MPVAGGGFEQCYNAQAVVAAGSLLVVATEVVQAANDKQQLQPMLDNPCVTKFGGLIGGLECDADAQALIKAILGLGNEQRAHG